MRISMNDSGGNRGPFACPGHLSCDLGNQPDPVLEKRKLKFKKGLYTPDSVARIQTQTGFRTVSMSSE
ncbi:hypothetical protein VULLAG_LOCUS9324 [Vulpes lagopus]